MAKFIGYDLHTGNWGEDYFIEKLMEYLDDTYVIYRNRPIFGAQFDVVQFTALSGRHSVLERPLSGENGRPFLVITPEIIGY
jgi:hypothetical protein